MLAPTGEASVRPQHNFVLFLFIARFSRRCKMLRCLPGDRPPQKGYADRERPRRRFISGAQGPLSFFRAGSILPALVRTRDITRVRPAYKLSMYCKQPSGDLTPLPSRHRLRLPINAVPEKRLASGAARGKPLSPGSAVAPRSRWSLSDSRVESCLPPGSLLLISPSTRQRQVAPAPVLASGRGDFAPTWGHPSRPAAPTARIVIGRKRLHRRQEDVRIPFVLCSFYLPLKGKAGKDAGVIHD